MEIITANSNPKIKNINKLNKNAAFRKEEQVFIVEGIRMFRELPVERVKQVFVSETAYRKYEAELSVKGITEQDGRLVVVSDSVFQSMSQTKTPQGLLAVVERYHYTMDDLISVMAKHEGGNTFWCWNPYRIPVIWVRLCGQQRLLALQVLSLEGIPVIYTILRWYDQQWERFSGCHLSMWMILWVRLTG